MDDNRCKRDVITTSTSLYEAICVTQFQVCVSLRSTWVTLRLRVIRTTPVKDILFLLLFCLPPTGSILNIIIFLTFTFSLYLVFLLSSASSFFFVFFLGLTSKESRGIA